MKIEDVKIGTPATIVYPHDSIAAVVVHRTPKRVTVARVEVGPVIVEEVAGPGAITRREGILDSPIDGTERTYTLKVRQDGSVVGRRTDSQPVVFGHSVSRTNSINF